jgi:hypothetical protein
MCSTFKINNNNLHQSRNPLCSVLHIHNKKQFLDVECVTKPQIMGYAAIKLPQMSYTVPNNTANRTSSCFKWWLCISQHAEVLSIEQSIIKEK